MNIDQAAAIAAPNTDPPGGPQTGERAMTTDEAIARLKEQQRDRDIENAHAEADHVLCDFLDSMGYSDVVAAYSAVPKWYA